MKKFAQALLRKAGIYQRVKTSIFYDAYWTLADRRLLDDRTREVAFYRALLSGFSPGDVIFDIGANIGQKTDVFLRLGARVIAVDPDTSNQRILRQRFLEWRLRPKPVTIVNKAVSESDGRQTFWIDAPGSAKNTLNSKWVETLRSDPSRFGEALQFKETREVETISMDSLIKAHGIPAFVKIDVEGHEPAVLKGLHQPVPLLSFEVNLPEFLPEAIQCAEFLAQLHKSGSFNFAPDVQQGLAFPQWLRADEFLGQLRKCPHPCVEVFWRRN
jgi:FkbM family methyltransferase